MLTAVVAHPPRFGGRFKTYDASRRSKVPGVRYVIEVPNGIAVVATTFWQAKKGRDALKIEWDDTSGFKLSSADIMAEYRRLAGTPGKVTRNDGDAAKADRRRREEARGVLRVPVSRARGDGADGLRGPARRRELRGLERRAVPDRATSLRSRRSPGSSPSRSSSTCSMRAAASAVARIPASDYLVEAAVIAKAILIKGKPGVPVKLVWTREDDMSGGYYRPAYLHALKAGLDGSGNIAGWQHRIVGQSILAGTPFEKMMVKEGIDATSVEGASTLPYEIPNLAVELHSPTVGVPVLWWRSVGSTHTAFSTETFIDELAQAAGKDPVAFRKAMLGKHRRHLGVLELAAAKAGWGTPLAPGKAGEKRGRGIAVHESFNTFVAQVAEVTVGKDGAFRVDRVVCAVDCGVAVNPDVVRAQMEGGIGFGLSAALYGRITLKDGVVEQSNFHEYQVLRINEMPAVEVHIVPSTEKPSGVGEPGVPVIAPAVANALAAATGQRLRTLPLKLGLTRARPLCIRRTGSRPGTRCPRRCLQRRFAFAFRDGKVLVSGDVEAAAAAASRAGASSTRSASPAPRITWARSTASIASPSAWPTTRPSLRPGAMPGLRSLFFALPDPLLALAARAFQIVDWDATHRYCGRCGTPTRDKPDERAKECPACGLVAYPRVTPAMMALVTRGREILLARAHRFPPGMWSALAGFVEPGETIEDCIRREVREEVGVEVERLEYFASQSWAFPHSLMIAFTAEYAGGELRPDDTEIAEARWFAFDAVPKLPPSVSIARRLIDATVERLARSAAAFLLEWLRRDRSSRAASDAPSPASPLLRVRGARRLAPAARRTAATFPKRRASSTRRDCTKRPRS